MKIFKALMLLGIALLLVNTVRAQEGESKAVDEVVARVNADFILKSVYEREKQALLDELKQAGLKDQELEKKFNELKATILDELIDRALVMQRAKELSLDVEPQVNEQLLRVMKENNLPDLAVMEEKMREAGIDINEVRRTLRSRFMFDAVKSREVFQEVYFKLTEKDKRDYYEKHKDWFVVPGEVKFRQIYIALGKDAAQALARATDVVSLARANGADFVALVQRYSEDEGTKKEGGLVGPLEFSKLRDEIRDAVEKAPTGTITDPIKLEIGYLILRVEERKEPEPKAFDAVQQAVAMRLTEERGQEKFETYLQKLRTDAFIEIDPRYQALATKNKSAQIKRTQYTEEKKKKDKDKDKKDAQKDAQKDGSKEGSKEAPKTTVVKSKL